MKKFKKCDSGKETQLQCWKFSSRKNPVIWGKKNYAMNSSKCIKRKTLKSKGSLPIDILFPVLTRQGIPESNILKCWNSALRIGLLKNGILLEKGRPERHCPWCSKEKEVPSALWLWQSPVAVVSEAGQWLANRHKTRGGNSDPSLSLAGALQHRPHSSMLWRIQQDTQYGKARIDLPPQAQDFLIIKLNPTPNIPPTGLAGILSQPLPGSFCPSFSSLRSSRASGVSRKWAEVLHPQPIPGQSWASQIIIWSQGFPWRQTWDRKPSVVGRPSPGD